MALSGRYCRLARSLAPLAPWKAVSSIVRTFEAIIAAFEMDVGTPAVAKVRKFGKSQVSVLLSPSSKLLPCNVRRTGELCSI